MHGSLIGLVPGSFVVVLIQNHCWYKTVNGEEIENAYRTVKTRRQNNLNQNKANAIGYSEELNQNKEESDLLFEGID